MLVSLFVRLFQIHWVSTISWARLGWAGWAVSQPVSQTVSQSATNFLFFTVLLLTVNWYLLPGRVSELLLNLNPNPRVGDRGPGWWIVEKRATISYDIELNCAARARRLGPRPSKSRPCF